MITGKAKYLVTGWMQTKLRSNRWIRRTSYRLGRSVYMASRGEQYVDDMHVNGEILLQARVLIANLETEKIVALDIGANQGDWTLALLESFSRRNHRGALLDLIAFEPIPTTRERFKKRLKTIDATHTITMTIEDFALSDEAGEMSMILMSETGGTNSLLYDKNMQKDALGFAKVQLVTMDQYCTDKGIQHIHIVKCDTEGNDLLVLRGARGMLEAGRIDVFQFEYNHRWIIARAYLKDVFELVEDLPYRVARIMPNSIEVFEAWHPELERYFQSNYVLIKESALDWFKADMGKYDISNSYA